MTPCEAAGVCALHRQAAELAGLARGGAMATAAAGGRTPPGVGGTVPLIRDQANRLTMLALRLRVTSVAVQARQCHRVASGWVGPREWTVLRIHAERAWLDAYGAAAQAYGRTRHDHG